MSSTNTTPRMHPLLDGDKWLNAVAIQDASTLKVKNPRRESMTTYIDTTDQELAAIVGRGIAFIDLRPSLDPNGTRFQFPLMGMDAREGRPSLVGSWTEAPPEMVGALARLIGAEVHNLPELKMCREMFRPMNERERAMASNASFLFDATPLMHMEGDSDRYLPAESATHLLGEWARLNDLIEGDALKAVGKGVPHPINDPKLSRDYHARATALQLLKGARNILSYETWKYHAGNYDSSRASYAGAMAAIGKFIDDHSNAISPYDGREQYDHLALGHEIAVEKLVECGLHAGQSRQPRDTKADPAP